MAAGYQVTVETSLLHTLSFIIYILYIYYDNHIPLQNISGSSCNSAVVLLLQRLFYPARTLAAKKGTTGSIQVHIYIYIHIYPIYISMVITYTSMVQSFALVITSYASTRRGADLANLLNEGAIMAARKAKTEMDADDAW